MSTPKTTYILGAASNLLGIALLIIAGLNISAKAHQTFADEVAWIAACCFAASCLLSYFSLRNYRKEDQLEAWADRIFIVGMLALFGSVIVLASSTF